MNIKTRFKGFKDTETIVEYTERRIGFSLGRFSSQIVSVNLTLIDENGPKGGVDQKCQIVVRLKGGNRLQVESLESSWQTAVDIAANRIDRMMSRHVESRRSLRFKSGMVPRERFAS